jgi:regulator of protease activity HflC (stomatin/prohibitin superfamily)
MASKHFSFRLSDAVVAALETYKQDDESLNQTAQRVISQFLGVTTLETYSQAQRIDIQELIRKEVASAIATSDHIKKLTITVDECLGKLTA